MKKAILIIIFILCFRLYPEEIISDVKYFDNNLIVDITLEGAEYSEMLVSLYEGLDVEIFFEIRLYKKAEGFF